jgi:hypothetical protein
MPTVRCKGCKEKFNVIPARLGIAKFCSYKCRGEWRTKNWTGKRHPNFQDGPRVLVCKHCSKKFRQRGTEAISEFRKRKFCSMECAKHGQKRLTGKAHPLYKEDSRRRNRRGKHGAWARAVISRDKATCKRCGARNVELHAHHIKPFHSHPEKRWDLDNGETLCHLCHWTEHSTAHNANAVNSGNIRPGKTRDNPEPSFGRKPIEGVTTRGRAFRRWNGSCAWCGDFISKRWSDTTGKRHLFCGFACAGKHTAASRGFNVNGSNASKSAARESDDIV